MKKRNHWIMGSALGLASIAIAIDHTSHQLPEPEANVQYLPDDEEDSPCSLSAPCSLDEAPCSLDSAPCSLDD